MGGRRCRNGRAKGRGEMRKQAAGASGPIERTASVRAACRFIAARRRAIEARGDDRAGVLELRRRGEWRR